MPIKNVSAAIVTLSVGCFIFCRLSVEIISSLPIHYPSQLSSHVSVGGLRPDMVIRAAAFQDANASSQNHSSHQGAIKN